MTAQAQHDKVRAEHRRALDETADINLRARLAEVEAERDGMRAALESIDVYGSDTLSGRVKPDPTTYKAWLIEGIVEMRNRARAALGARP